MKKNKKVPVVEPEVKTLVKRFKVFGDEDQYEYDIVVTQEGFYTTYELWTSNNEIWSDHMRRTLRLKFIDTGDIVEFYESFKTLEYDEVEEFRLLLNFRNYYDTAAGMLSTKYVILPETDVITF